MTARRRDFRGGSNVSFFTLRLLVSWCRDWPNRRYEILIFWPVSVKHHLVQLTNVSAVFFGRM